MTNAEVLHQVEHGYRMPSPPGCPRALYEIMLECWARDEMERPTFETLQWKLEEFFVLPASEYSESTMAVRWLYCRVYVCTVCTLYWCLRLFSANWKSSLYCRQVSTVSPQCPYTDCTVLMCTVCTLYCRPVLLALRWLSVVKECVIVYTGVFQTRWYPRVLPPVLRKKINCVQRLRPLDAFSTLFVGPKCICGQGCASIPEGGAYSAPQTP